MRINISSPAVKQKLIIKLKSMRLIRIFLDVNFWVWMEVHNYFTALLNQLANVPRYSVCMQCMDSNEVYVILFSILKSLFFSNLFAELGGQELEPPAFLPELLNTPERILSKNALNFTFYGIALQC